MAWENKRKIHVARGTNDKLVAAKADNQTFTDGQPLFNKSKGYLSIANITKLTDGYTNPVIASVMDPVKTRTIEGYTTDTETDNSFILTDTNTGHYIFTGRDGKVYLKTTPNFYLYRQGIDGINTGDIKDTDILVLNIDGDNNLILNDNYYSKIKNIRTTNLYDLSGNRGIEIGASEITLNKSLVSSQNVTFNGTTTLNGNTNILGKTLIFGKTDKSSTISVYGNTTIDGTTVIDGTTTITGIKLTISANTELNSNIHNALNTLVINPTDASIKTATFTSTDIMVNNLFAGNGIETDAPLEVINNKITLRQPTDITGKVTIGTTSTSATTVIEKVYGTLEVDCINLITSR